jgi:hypothetical protein
VYLNRKEKKLPKNKKENRVKGEYVENLRK